MHVSPIEPNDLKMDYFSLHVQSLEQCQKHGSWHKPKIITTSKYSAALTPTQNTHKEYILYCFYHIFSKALSSVIRPGEAI